MKRSSLILLGAAAVLVSGAAAGGSGTAVAVDRFSTSLNAQDEVPAPSNVPAQATGQFSATLTGSAFKFTLTFSNLSSDVLGAYIQQGVTGRTGGLLIPLCGPCRATNTATAHPTPVKITALKTGKAYVSIKTTKNPSGEIRGQIALTD